jgi:hypothetical protein
MFSSCVTVQATQAYLMQFPHEIVHQSKKYSVEDFDVQGRTFIAVGLSSLKIHPTVWTLMPENVKIMITRLSPCREPANSVCGFKFLATLE